MTYLFPNFKNVNMNSRELLRTFDHKISYDLESFFEDVNSIILDPYFSDVQLSSYAKAGEEHTFRNIYPYSQLTDEYPEPNTEIVITIPRSAPLFGHILVQDMIGFALKQNITYELSHFEEDVNLFVAQYHHNPNHIAIAIQTIIKGLEESISRLRAPVEIYESLLEERYFEGFGVDDCSMCRYVAQFLTEALEKFYLLFSDKYDLYAYMELDQKEFDVKYHEIKEDFQMASQKALLLNELGIIDFIRQRYAGISNRKLAILLSKVVGLPKYDTLRRAIDSIENPPVNEALLNNPYINEKNLTRFNKFMAKLELDAQY